MIRRKKLVTMIFAGMFAASLIAPCPFLMESSYAVEEDDPIQEQGQDEFPQEDLTQGEQTVQDETENEPEESELSESNTEQEEHSSLTQIVNGQGEIILSNEDPEPGEEVTVTATAANGYYLAQIRIGSDIVQQDQDIDEGQQDEPQEELLDEPEKEYQTLSLDGESATFTMPETDTTVYADFISKVWDGTIDLTWYDPSETTIKIKYPAQLEGAAALTAGLFNDMPTREIELSDEGTANIPDISDEEGDPIDLDELNKTGYVSSCNGSGYQVFSDLDGDDIDTTVVGDISLLKIYHKESDVGSNNLVTSNVYWYGGEDFTGKKIVLERDLDMGGVLSEGTLKTVMDNWSGPNYMPLGGQYSMDSNNGYTRLSAGFNGTFDGKGHMVYNIYAARHAPSATFGNCQSVGLIGLLGIYRVEYGTVSKPIVRNVAIDGFINGNRSIGGIVGKTVHAKGAVVENCMNFATIYNTDAKGCGGIVGAAWFDASYGDAQPQIRNCANLGLVCTGYNKNAGGLVGSNEAMVSDSYTIGYAAGEGKGNDDAGQSLGTNNGGAVWYNCYTLEAAGSGTGTTPGSNTQQVFNSTFGSAIRVLNSPEDMKTADGLLNGKVKNNGPDENGYMDSDDDIIKNTKRNWLSGKETGSNQFISSHMLSALQATVSWRDPEAAWPDSNAGSSEFTLAAIAGRLKPVDGEGLPVPRTFFHDSSSLEDIIATGTPTKEYLAGEFFDTGDHDNQSTGPEDNNVNHEFAVWAVFSDGTYQEIEDYSISYEGGASEFTNDSDDDVTTTSVTVSGKYLGRDFSFEIDGISVTKSTLLSMEATVDPNNLLYAKGEAFDPEGLVISEDYGVKGQGDEQDDVRMTIKATFQNGQVSITKRIKEANSSEYREFSITGEAANAFAYVFDEDRYNLEAGKTEMNMHHTFNNVTKTVSIPITVLDSEAPRLVKDGENNRQIVYIASEDDFKWFANQIAAGIDTDMYAVLEEDLSIGGDDFLPVGIRLKGSTEAKQAYSGDFDGQGHTITVDIRRGSKLSGLFYDIEEGGCIHDLTITGSVIGGSNTGALTAYLNDGSLRNCINNATITGTGSCVGGIAGDMSSAESIISDCRNTGSIRGKTDIGGIVGRARGTGTISKCSNAGSIYAEDTSSASAGGLVGEIGSNMTIEQSRNSGLVSGNGSARLGGITGYISAPLPALVDCYNQGIVLGTGVSEDAYVGGIAGLIRIGSNYKNITITNCYNSGMIYYSEVCANIGGIVGKTSGFSKMTNNYTLKDPDIENAMGSTSDTPGENNVQVLTSAEMISDGAAKLGEAYKDAENACPILSWEEESVVSNDFETGEAALTDFIKSDKESAELVIKRFASKVGQLNDEYSACREKAETAANELDDEAAEAAQTAYEAACRLQAAAQKLSDLVDISKDVLDEAESMQQTASDILTEANNAVESSIELKTQISEEIQIHKDAGTPGGHQWIESIEKATFTQDGRVDKTCSVCKAERTVKTIRKISTIEVTKTSYTYTGKAIKPGVIVSDEAEVITPENYAITYANNTNAGTATVKVTFQGDYYSGTKNLTFTIAKAANPLAVSGKTATLKFKTLKKKNQTLARAKVLAVSKNQGAVTYVKSSGNGKISINKKTGKVTVKKKLKKGTYAVKVKVTAAGNANYKALTKTVTFKIKVKK